MRKYPFICILVMAGNGCDVGMRNWPFPTGATWGCCGDGRMFWGGVLIWAGRGWCRLIGHWWSPLLTWINFNPSASFDVFLRYYVWKFNGTFWNFAQNILPILWKMLLYNVENLRALTFTSQYAFLKRHPGLTWCASCKRCGTSMSTISIIHLIAFVIL